MPDTKADVTTVGELADTLGVQSWRIARLFELGLLPEPPRLSGRRIISTSSIPSIVEALQDRGWLSKQQGLAE